MRCAYNQTLDDLTFSSARPRRGIEEKMTDPHSRVCFDECVTDAEPPIAQPAHGVYVTDSTEDVNATEMRLVDAQTPTPGATRSKIGACERLAPAPLPLP